LVPPDRLAWGTADSPLGELVVGLTEENQLCRASFVRERNVVDIVEEWQADWKRTGLIIGAVPKNVLTLPLLMIGTDLQGRAWQEIMRIPRGQTASYGEIAQRIGRPGAARAVGAACGKNHLAYIVPCHRVIAAGGIGGYGASGLDIKRELLRAEGVRIS